MLLIYNKKLSNNMNPNVESNLIQLMLKIKNVNVIDKVDDATKNESGRQNEIKKKEREKGEEQKRKKEKERNNYDRQIE